MQPKTKRVVCLGYDNKAFEGVPPYYLEVHLSESGSIIKMFRLSTTFIKGTEIGGWKGARPPAIWTEVLPTYMQVGEGL